VTVAVAATGGDHLDLEIRDQTVEFHDRVGHIRLLKSKTVREPTYRSRYRNLRENISAKFGHARLRG
jgi:hypothetical protein